MESLYDIEIANPMTNLSSLQLNINKDSGELSNSGSNNFLDSELQPTVEDGVSFTHFKDYRSKEDFILLLASTYIDEAANGRNGSFVPEPKELRMYYWYNHKGIRSGLFVLIWINMSLVFFEDPAVPGLALPYWITMLIELVCLIGYCLRLFHTWKCMPLKGHWKDKKIIIVFISILLTLIDMGVAIILTQLHYEKFVLRWSRVLRPLFMINFSESRQVRRTVRNIRRTLPEIVSVLILFLLVIGLFSLLGLKLFEHRSIVGIHQEAYFSNYWDIYFNLYVLTTTANNPDLMIPAYSRSNWFSLFFTVFTIICMYMFVSIFLAVVYKNYRSHLKDEVKASVYRKRRNMKSAFDCLKMKHGNKWMITFQRWKQLMHYIKPNMNPVQVILFWRVLDENEEHAIEFKNFVHMCDLLHIKMDTISVKGHIFLKMFPTIYLSKISLFIQTCVKHRLFVYFFDLVIMVNAVCIGVGEDTSEIAFLILFNVEIFLKFYTLGPKEFIGKSWNVFDTLVIGAATVVYILEAMFQVLQYSRLVMDFLLILRVMRLFKIIGNIKRFEVIIKTITEIGPAIITYGGIIFVLYYVYAIMGMELFEGHIHNYTTDNLNNLTQMQYLCGNSLLNGSEFVRLRYCEKNFNDILKAYIVLFDLMVVNQWHVITDGFVRVTTKAARLYFFSFHLLCVIVVLNIFVAFILEAFMLQFSLSKGNFEATFEKKIDDKGRASSTSKSNAPSSSRAGTSSLQRLDINFVITDYINETDVTFTLRKRRTKNAETLLQQMFEDELDQKDLGPEFDDDHEELEEVLENINEANSERKLTLKTVDFV